MNKNNLSIIGYACGIGAENTGCKFGPDLLKKSPFLQQLDLNLEWETFVECPNTSHKLSAIPIIADLNTTLAKKIDALVSLKKRFLVLGGDHTSAIGTWRGVKKALAAKDQLGLLWIDAHLDSHTLETTPSGNMHGVPVAALLGYIKEFQELNAINPILLPQNICFIGIRSFEPAEKEFLDGLGVKIFYMEEVQRKGLKTVFQEALDIIKLNTTCYGISLDLDAIDPQEAPGVGTPEADGIHHHDLCEALMQVNQDDRFVGAEIVEFNPLVDKEHKTEKIIVQLISSMFTTSRKANEKKY